MSSKRKKKNRSLRFDVPVPQKKQGPENKRKFEMDAKVEVSYEGTTKNFRINEVVCKSPTIKDKRLQRVKPSRSRLNVADDRGDIIRDDKRKPRKSDSSTGDADIALLESSLSKVKETLCYLRKLQIDKKPYCRLFGVYITTKAQDLSAYKKSRKISQQSIADTDECLAEKSVEMLASFVPYSVLENLIVQVNKNTGKSGMKQNTLRYNVHRRQKIRGAILIADVSHFTKLAQNYVRNDFKNIHNQNTRSIASEQLFKLLHQEIFSVIVDLIAKAGGDVYKFVGDAIFAVFPVNEQRHSMFKDGATAVKAAVYVALEAFRLLDRQVHYGISFGTVYYNTLGRDRFEGFLTGEGLNYATAAEEEASFFSDLDKYIPLVITPEVHKRLYRASDHIVGQYSVFQAVSRVKINRKEDSKNPTYLVALNDTEDRTFAKALRKACHQWHKNEKNNIYSFTRTKLKTLLKNPRKADLLRSILRLSCPKIVSTYLYSAGIPLWATELRISTSMFIHISGDWNELTEEKLQLLQTVVCKIQENVKDCGGEFLRFVIDDKGAYCFVCFGLKQRTESHSALQATLCAIHIHEAVEVIRKSRKVSSRKRSRYASKSGSYIFGNGTMKRKKMASLDYIWQHLSVSAGITTGKVICGNVGAQSRVEYTLHGECVNFACNLMNHAKKLNAGDPNTANIVSRRRRKNKKNVFVDLQDQQIKYMPKILVGKEVYNTTRSHVEYKNQTHGVNDHHRAIERTQDMDGKDLQGQAYIVKGVCLPHFSLDYKEVRKDEKQIMFVEKKKLVGRIHNNSKLKFELEKFAKDESDELWVICRGSSGMGKTVALGQLYNFMKEAYPTNLTPLLVQSTCVETNSRLFVLRAIILQLVQQFDKNQEQSWPKTRSDAYERVKEYIKLKLEGNYLEFKEALKVIFIPDGSIIKDFTNIGNTFSALITELVKLKKGKCVFVVDDWHIMNEEVARVLVRLAECINCGIIASVNITSPVIALEDKLNKTEYTLTPLRVHDFLALGDIWCKIPMVLLRYIIKMVNGNPRHAQELLEIVKQAGWLVTKGDKHVITLEAYSCIQDEKLEYRDFVNKQQKRTEDPDFIATLQKSTFHLRRVEESSRTVRSLNRNIRQNRRAVSVTSKSMTAKLLKPKDGDKIVPIKFTEYFDDNMYVTEEKLTNYIDQCNPIEHMCVKIAAVLGVNFTVNHLCFVLSNMNDEVLGATFASVKRHSKIYINAAEGNSKLLAEILKMTFNNLVDMEIFKLSISSSNFMEEQYKFKTPLLREVTLNFVPNYLKQVIYRLVAKSINLPEFADKYFLNSVERNSFITSFTDAAHSFEVLDDCYRAMKNLEQHSMYTGDVKYYFDAMYRLNVWHSFFKFGATKKKKKLHTLKSERSNTTRLTLSVLNKNKESFASELLLERFQKWYKKLDKVEIGRSLRIGAQKVLWFSNQSFASKVASQRFASQIAKFGVKWLDSNKEMYVKDKGKSLSLKLELFMLYATFRTVVGKNKCIRNTDGTKWGIELREEVEKSMSLQQKVEFYSALACFVSKSSTCVTICTNLEVVLEETLTSIELSTEEKHFILFTVLSTKLRIWKEHVALNASVSKETLKQHLLFKPKHWLELCNMLELNTNDICWRSNQIEYLGKLLSVTTTEEQEKLKLKKIVESYIKRVYGPKWRENEKYNVSENEKVLKLYKFIK